MAPDRYVFLTGVTGFLGSHIACRLLERGDRLGVLARPAGRRSARDRVREALAKAAGLPASAAGFTERVDVFDGDVARPGLGLSDDALRHIASGASEVWHAAASLGSRQGRPDDVARVNVDGTRHVLELVERTSGRRLHHVSTAYVAGTRTDLVRECELDAGQAFRNPYEASKFRAEVLIRDAQARGTVRATVYRPSIVIGDSTSGRVTHHHGPYAFIRGIWRLCGRTDARPSGAGSSTLALRILGCEAATLNFVPIDYVVDGMLAIAGQAGSAGAAYHLANPHPTENHLWLSRICAVLRVESVCLVDHESFATQPMTRREQIFHKQMSFYRQYLGGGPRFDCRGALDALEGTSVACPRMTAAVLDMMARRYLESLRTR